jgi:hypothetical protein
MGRKPEITEAGRKAIAVAEGHRAEARRRLAEQEKAYTQAICDAWGLEPGKLIVSGGKTFALGNSPYGGYYYGIGTPRVMACKLKKDGTPAAIAQSVSGWEWVD